MPAQHPLTLAIAVLGPQHFPTGETTYYVDPSETEVTPAMLRIVQYEGDAYGVYLLYCDANGLPLLDTFHNSIDDAEEQARVALQVQADEWRRRNGKRVMSDTELEVALFEIISVIQAWATVQSRIVVDAELNARLIFLGDDLATTFAKRKLVSKWFVGLSWYVFTELLYRAQFAADPDHVWNAAWRWQERLQQVFGPHGSTSYSERGPLD